MVKVTNYFTKDGLGVLCLMIPLMFKWMLPSGIEENLYVDVLGIFYLFIPNLLLLFTPFLFYGVKKRNKAQVVLYIFWVSVVFITTMLSKSNYPTYNIFSNFFVAGALYLGLFYKCTKKQTDMIRPLLYISVLAISLQFILYGTILDYSFGGDGQDFAGVIRVHTTAGAATGAGAILAILSVLVLYMGGASILKWGVFLVGVVGVFFTVSRSPIALLVLVAAFLLLHYRKTNKKILIYTLLGIVVLYSAGVFDPILARQKQKSESDNFWSRRDDLVSETLSNVTRESAVFEGLGVGNVYASTEVIYAKKKVPFEGAPHNSYVLLFSEQGLVCFICVTLILLIFFVNGYKNNKELTVFMLFVMATVIFSETATTTNSEYVYLLSILMMMINSDHKYLAFSIMLPKRIMKYEKSIIHSNN